MIIRLSVAGVAAAVFAAGIVVTPRIPAPVFAAADTLKAIPQPSKDDRARVEWLERSLAHDSMEGRGLATAGEHRAAVFLAGQMKRIGLAPGGDDGYYQRIPLAMVPPVPRDPNAPARGGGGRGAQAPDPPQCLPQGPHNRPQPTAAGAGGAGRGGGGRVSAEVVAAEPEAGAPVVRARSRPMFGRRCPP